MTELTELDAAHLEALDINRRRDRITRWINNGGLSPDPMTRYRADAMLRIDESLDDPRNLIHISLA